MANAITFIEILSQNAKDLGSFYQDVFGWKIYPPQGAMDYRIMDPETDNGVMAAIGAPYAGENWLAFIC